MSNDNHEQTVALADLSATKVEDENPQVASKVDRLESRIDDIQSEKAEVQSEKASVESRVEELEAELDDVESEHEDELAEVEEQFEDEIAELENELEARNEIIEDIRESDRQEALARLTEAKASLNGVETEEVDVSNYEEADVTTIRNVADDLEAAAERANATSGATSTEEDLDVSATSDSTLDEDRKRQVANEMGVLDQLEEAENLAPQGFEVDGTSEVN